MSTISRSRFEQIYDWKAARARRHVQRDNFQMYDSALRDALRASKDQKGQILVGLPGIGMPVASTILHFVYPETSDCGLQDG